jgi:archaellin
VTFSTGSKSGQQTKTITVTSNDPDNKNSKLKVKALIEIAFGFSSRGLNFGTISMKDSATKSVFIEIKDPTTTQLTELVSSSPLIEVRQLPATADTSGGSKIEVEIMLKPGHEPGKLNETITAKSNLEGKRESKLRISGTIQGDIELNPMAIRFNRVKDDEEKSTKSQTVHIVNKTPERDLNILAVEDPDGRLELELKTLQGGQRYELVATMNGENLGETNYLKGKINISTDNPKQPTVTVDYVIYSRK